MGGRKIASNAVNSAKIADGSVATADLAQSAVGGQEIAANAVNSAKIANGGVATPTSPTMRSTRPRSPMGRSQIGDISAAAQDALTAYSGANWGVMDRNVINNGDAYLRAGPAHAGDPARTNCAGPPFGVGSLGIRTGGRDNATGGPSDDKTEFGNEVDFARTLVSDLTAVSFYRVHDGGERRLRTNLPNISIEIDPNSPGWAHFTSMVYEPAPLPNCDGLRSTPWPIPFPTGGSPEAIHRARHVTSRHLMHLDSSDDIPGDGDGTNDAVIGTVGHRQGTRLRLLGRGRRPPDQRHGLRLRAQRSLRHAGAHRRSAEVAHSRSARQMRDLTLSNRISNLEGTREVTRRPRFRGAGGGGAQISPRIEE